MRAFPLALIIAAAFAPPALAAPDAKNDSTVVVTGLRLSESERALKECIARKCPVEEDVAATLRHAENLFVAGRYGESRNTLYAGRGRTRRFANTNPVAVSTVTRAIATVSAHLGDPEPYQLSTIDTLDVLKAGLPRDDARVLSARLEVAVMFAALGRFEAADEVFVRVANQARERDLVQIRGIAELRRAALYSAAAVIDPGTYAQGEAQAINAVLRNTDPRYRVFVQAARVLQARKSARAGDPKPLDAVLAELRRDGASERPVLVYAPPIASIRDSARGAIWDAGLVDGVPTTNALSRLPLRLFDDQWVDVSFYVAPDGHVTDVGILRGSPKLESDDWVKPVLGSIALRRYLPLKRDANDPGVLRVERYTLTSLLEVRTGSRIRQRAPEPRIEVLDLSIDPAPPEPKRGSI